MGIKLKTTVRPFAALVVVTFVQALPPTVRAVTWIGSDGADATEMMAFENSALAFVKTATRVKVTSEADIGAISRKHNDQAIMFFHYVPYSNDLHQYQSSMTLDGKEIPISSSVDMLKRPMFFGKGDASSGKAKLVFSGIIYERVVGPNDKLAVPVDLSQTDTQRYLAPSWAIRTEGDQYMERLKGANLVRKSTETPWDYMVRLAEYLRAHFQYGPPETSGDDIRTYLIFESKHFKCNDATIFLGRAARTNGIPFRCLPGMVLMGNGEVDYHSRGEFYDRERGWVPVDGAELMHRDVPLFQVFGRDVPRPYQRANWRFVPLVDNSGLNIKVDGAGSAGGNFGFYSEFMQCFSYGVPGTKDTGGAAPPDTTHASFESSPVKFSQR